MSDMEPHIKEPVRHWEEEKKGLTFAGKRRNRKPLARTVDSFVARRRDRGVGVNPGDRQRGWRTVLSLAFTKAQKRLKEGESSGPKDFAKTSQTKAWRKWSVCPWTS